MYSGQNPLLDDRRATREIMQLLEPQQSEPAVYEIVAVRYKEDGRPIYTKSAGNMWKNGNAGEISNEIINGRLEENTVVEIYSVKVLSTGETLTIGDKIESSISKTLGMHTVTRFRIDENAGGGLSVITSKDSREIEIAITCAVKYQEPDDEVRKYRTLTLNLTDKELQDISGKYQPEPIQEEKKPILITEDGISITDPQAPIYGIHKSWEHKSNLQAGDYKPEYTFYVERKWFSSEAAREEYILMSRPLFSIKQLGDIEREDYPSTVINEEIVVSRDSLLRIAKEIINQNK